jgi:hypothetical protein
MTNRLSAVLIVCPALSATTGLAHARVCADQITQLPQAAQFDHDPTPESVGQAQTNFGEKFHLASCASPWGEQRGRP